MHVENEQDLMKGKFKIKATVKQDPGDVVVFVVVVLLLPDSTGSGGTSCLLNE